MRAYSCLAVPNWTSGATVGTDARTARRALPHWAASSLFTREKVCACAQDRSLHWDMSSTLRLAALPCLALCTWPQCEGGAFVSDIPDSCACVAEALTVGLATERTWDNEQDSSHTDADAGTHSSSADRQKTSTCLNCINVIDAILMRKSHLNCAEDHPMLIAEMTKRILADREPEPVGQRINRERVAPETSTERLTTGCNKRRNLALNQ